jgi:hypothetical protein
MIWDPLINKPVEDPLVNHPIEDPLVKHLIGGDSFVGILLENHS